MKKTIYKIKIFLFVLTFGLLGVLIYSFFSVPDEICKVPEENVKINSIYSLSVLSEETAEIDAKTINNLGEYKAEVSLFKSIPIKSINLKVSNRKYVVVSGEIFGLRMFTEGVIIVETEGVLTEFGERNPAKEAGLVEGDIILKVNDIKIISCLQLTEIFSKLQGESFKLTYKHDGKENTTDFSLALSKQDQKYMAGLWIKDSAAGIGTMTFFDVQSGMFGGLGHAVCDVDTGKVLPLYNGDIVEAKINGCYKGKPGQAGELCGTFCGESMGSLDKNSDCGVFGFLFKTDKNVALTPVALKNEVEEGEAYIISTVDSGEPEKFSVKIEKIDFDDNQYRNFVIKVTDKALIEKTGGIVQGMSGSPIIQDGKLVGAVTHVLVNDPTRGYGIFIENMLEATNTVAEEQQMKEAS
ncbi:MAG: SpoIVB peptidase [Clostridia bacterium]|nr:SpoIVB peptidase [Clostridia bacterium]